MSKQKEVSKKFHKLVTDFATDLEELKEIFEIDKWLYRFYNGRLDRKLDKIDSMWEPSVLPLCKLFLFTSISEVKIRDDLEYPSGELKVKPVHFITAYVDMRDNGTSYRIQDSLDIYVVKKDSGELVLIGRQGVPSRSNIGLNECLEYKWVKVSCKEIKND